MATWVTGPGRRGHLALGLAPGLALAAMVASGCATTSVSMHPTAGAATHQLASDRTRTTAGAPPASAPGGPSTTTAAPPSTAPPSTAPPSTAPRGSSTTDGVTTSAHDPVEAHTAVACTQAEEDAPAVTTMPAPAAATSPTDVGPESVLDPPDETPAVGAAQAWRELVANGFAPRAGGTVRLVLGELSAAYPAQIQGYVWPPTPAHPDLQSTPLYPHTLVWALVATDQAAYPVGAVMGPPTSAGVTTVPAPTCGVKTVVSFVDAHSGQRILTQSF